MPTVTERVFSVPSEELVRHAERELAYSERLTGYSASPAVGSQNVEMYSFAQAGKFLIGNNWANLLEDGTKSSLNYVDMAKLVTWFREVIGDSELADAVEQDVAGAKSYMEQADAAGAVLKARFMQYLEVVPASMPEEAEAEEAN
ncbi:MAG: hypothetical protein CVT66_03445 [Actinobacteria bacterium HGW-Actinobacteria-6]|jgi:hypothetical protein|nr:MAG: hypothetical protein CVT66_03445 [Actinobacteria bacterium HGW-Actinobacteria-6]